MSWTESERGQELVHELARDVITDFAPEEADLFEEYYDDPNPPNPDEEAEEDPLGFGLSGVLAASTPVAIAASTVVVNFVIQIIAKSVEDAGTDFIREKLRAVFKPETGQSDDKASPLTKEDLARAHTLAYEEALRYRLSEEEANNLANAVLSRLVMDG